jgi:hypothetical protein
MVRREVVFKNVGHCSCKEVRMRGIIVTVLLLAGWIAVQSAHAAAIEAISTNGQNTIGFLQLDSPQDRYIVGAAASEDSFTVNGSGLSGNSFLDTNAPASHDELAGLISPGVELLATNANAAVMGDSSVSTAPGSTPQSGGSPSIPGSEYETSIWSLSGTPGNYTMTPEWVNHDGSTPSETMVWDPMGQTLYLTANPAAVILNHPGAQSVTLEYLGTIPGVPEPSAFALLSIAVGGVGFLARRWRIATKTN